MVVHLSWPGGPLRGTFRLPASKSESNRVLILRALAGGGTIDNLSEAHDTRLLAQLLNAPTDTPTYDCEDAGTTLRFLTAYCAVTDRRCVITGTARMRERPIGPLVDALRELGANIEYLKNEGFPPLRLQGFQYSGRAEVTVPASVSSQFISALLLVAPALPEGLTVRLAGEVSSAPYLLLTVAALRQWGAHVQAERKTTAAFIRHADGVFRPVPNPPPPQISAVTVAAGGLRATTHHVVEADWSSAAFAYALMTAGQTNPDAELWLPGLRLESLQGDRRIAEWLAIIGLNTEPAAGGVWLRWGEWAAETTAFHFTDCPDLAPPFIVALAGITAAADFTGLQSLRVKESDRLAALQAELAKFGTELLELDEGEASLVARPGEEMEVNSQRVATYHDHRIAMAFAALAMLGPLTIEDPGVVRKSFPDFWTVLLELGFDVEFENE